MSTGSNSKLPSTDLLRLISNVSSNHGPSAISSASHSHRHSFAQSQGVASPSPTSSNDIESRPLVQNAASFDDDLDWSEDGSPNNRHVIAARKIKSWFAESLIVSILGACCFVSIYTFWEVSLWGFQLGSCGRGCIVVAPLRVV